MELKIIKALSKLTRNSKDKETLGLDTIFQTDNVFCATDMYRIGLIDKTKKDWDFGDVILEYIRVNGTKESNASIDVIKLFESLINGFDTVQFTLDKPKLKEILKLCKEKQKEHKIDIKDLTPTQRKHSKKYTEIFINIETFDIISKIEGDVLWFENQKVICFNSIYLIEILEFMLCSPVDSFDFYYRSKLSPIAIKSDCLYSLVLPLKIK